MYKMYTLNVLNVYSIEMYTVLKLTILIKG